MPHRWRREIAVALVIAVLSSGLVASPLFDAVRGLSVDLLIPLRQTILGPRHAPGSSAVAVVALDEETYRTPPFAGTPNVFWTRQLAGVLNALLDADAKVIGVDLIYPTSIEAFVPGFERDWLRALHRGAADDRLVLAKVQHSREPIRPAAAQSFAVGHDRNIRATNLVARADGVIRHAPLFFDRAEGGVEPGFALEIAARTLGAAPQTAPGGGVVLAGRRLAGAGENDFPIGFEGGAGSVPSYSLADLAACAAKGDAEFFRRHFAGKTVLVGVSLDVEDRKLTAKRFATVPDRGATGERCALPPRPELAAGAVARNTIPGVFVHAAAIDNILRGEILRVPGPLAAWAAAFALALLAGVATRLLPPLPAVGAAMVGGGGWTLLAVGAFSWGCVLPLVEPLAAAAFAVAATLGYRFAVADREKRFLRRSFQNYLAPAVVERLVRSGRPPELGGEERSVTVFFSDVAGFSTLSEGLSPVHLVTVMNEYLSAMTDIVEAHGGFVDKYIGDAIVAVFGAPLDDPDHAAKAVAAALACERRLAEMNASGTAFAGRTLLARIGLATGETLVGNMGSRRRFNYTAMGDTVNLAARLEGANKIFGTGIMVSQTTAQAAGDGFLFREIDEVRVVGRGTPERVFEPLAPAADATAADRQRKDAYEAALGHWRARQLDKAAAGFAALTAGDLAAAKFGARVAVAQADPAAWSAINTLETK